MSDHQNFHLVGICKGKQAEQIYCKEVQSKQHWRTSQSNRRAHCCTNQKPHMLYWNSNQKHHQRDEGNDVCDKKQLAPNNQQASNNQSNNEKKKKREERHKKYNDTPICKHCGKKYPAKQEDKYWKLETNKDSRPSNWKSAKSTWRCEGPIQEIETWQPGKVQLNKLNTSHTYHQKWFYAPYYGV